MHFIKKKFFKIFKYYILIILFTILYILFTYTENCKKNVIIKNNKKNNYNLLFDVKLISTDDNKIICIYTPLIKQLNNLLEVILFPKGIFITYYNNYYIKLISLKADWCKYYKVNNLYNIRGNVLINTYNNDKLLTSNIFLDKKKRYFIIMFLLIYIVLMEFLSMQKMELIHLLI